MWWQRVRRREKYASRGVGRISIERHSRATRASAPAKTDLRAGARSPAERVCLSPSPFPPIRLSRSRSDYHPNHAIPRGTAIISFPARSADWLVQSQPRRSGEERRGGAATRSVLLALAPSTGEEQRRVVELARCRGTTSSGSALLRRRAAACRRGKK